MLLFFDDDDSHNDDDCDGSEPLTMLPSADLVLSVLYVGVSFT